MVVAKASKHILPTLSAAATHNSSAQQTQIPKYTNSACALIFKVRVKSRDDCSVRLRRPTVVATVSQPATDPFHPSLGLVYSDFSKVLIAFGRKENSRNANVGPPKCELFGSGRILNEALFK